MMSEVSDSGIAEQFFAPGKHPGQIHEPCLPIKLVVKPLECGVQACANDNELINTKVQKRPVGKVGTRARRQACGSQHRLLGVFDLKGQWRRADRLAQSLCDWIFQQVWFLVDDRMRGTRCGSEDRGRAETSYISHFN